MLLNLLLGAVACLSLGLTVWQWLVAKRFPLHERRCPVGPRPSVTVLKPLKGADFHTEMCLRSWLAQDYGGELQVLFGIASKEDPAFDLAQRLVAEYPHREVKVVLCPNRLGANAKVSTLVQLQPFIRHEIVVVCDADVQAPADLLDHLGPPLAQPEAGLVHCFYRLANPSTWAMHWEAVAINADFWSQVLQSQSLKPMDFALGAVMATSRQRLQQIGGFETLVNYLADDFQLGNRIARAGGQITICPIVVDCWSEPTTFERVWTHQLRWARTIRVCQPIPYFFSILSNATLWPLLWFLLQPGFGSALLFGVCIVARLSTAFDNHRRLSRDTARLSLVWLPLAKDILGVFLWMFAFGRTIEWRGVRYHVGRGGQMAARD